MKVFQNYQKWIPFLVGYDILANYGIVAPNPFRKHLCYIISRLDYALFLCGIIFAGGFLIFEAQTPQEYSDNSYVLLALINSSLLNIALKWKCEITLKSFQKIEEIINNRKYSFRISVNIPINIFDSI